MRARISNLSSWHVSPLRLIIKIEFDIVCEMSLKILIELVAA